MSYMYVIILKKKSKFNKERENQVIILMITDGKKWHYLAFKNCPRYLEE